MPNEIIRISDAPTLPAPGLSPVRPDVVALLLKDKRSAATRRAYRGDLTDFFGIDPDLARDQVAAFLMLPPPAVALRLTEYKADLMARGLAEATVNRRLAAVRSLLKFSARLGLATTDGRGLVDSERAKSYRDTRGVDVPTLKKLLALPDSKTLRGKRDRGLLLLLIENALRRAEVCALRVADLEIEQRRLLVIGKGRGTQRSPITISSRVVGALTAYLLTAGHGSDPSGALFRNVDHRTRGAGLTPDGLHAIVAGYGERLGIKLAPHKLRHSAITAALDATNGDVRRVQKLSRHADIRTLTIYDDARADHQGEVSNLLAKIV